MFTGNFEKFVRVAVAALCVCITGCDEETTDESAEVALPCNLADEACAALPLAAEAAAVIEAMGVDVDAADIELVDEPFDAERMSVGEIAAEDPGPQTLRQTCNGEDSVFCCCYWDGPWWGCVCYG